MLDKPITLAVSTLARTVELNNLGGLHATIAPTREWAPIEDEQSANSRARAAIAGVNGIDRHGRLDADFEATLRLLCAPQVEFYGWMFSKDGPTIGVLVAATGRDAVLAIREGDDVRLRQVQPERLPDVLVAQTPEVAPARGQAITVTLADLQQPASSSQVAVSVRTNRSAEARLAQQIIEIPAVGGGQLYTAVRDGSGRRRKVENPLRYADTVNGRFLNLTLPGPEPRVIIAPADRRALAMRLHDMHMGLIGR